MWDWINDRSMADDWLGNALWHLVEPYWAVWRWRNVGGSFDYMMSAVLGRLAALLFLAAAVFFYLGRGN